MKMCRVVSHQARAMAKLLAPLFCRRRGRGGRLAGGEEVVCGVDLALVLVLVEG